MPNHGFIKLAAAVPEVGIGDVSFNCNEIIRLAKEAYSGGAQAIVFPELSVTGYSAGDLLLSDALLGGAQDGVADILNAISNLDIICIIGLPVFDGVRLLNCAAVLHKGKILGMVPKTYIPNYGEFYEGRWFASGNDANETIEFCGQAVPLGAKLIFDCGGFKFAIELCEDMWVSSPPSASHTLNGANVIFNLSACNAVAGKADHRKAVVKHRSFTSHCAYVYVSAGITESTTDTLFSANTIFAENGSIIKDETNFSFESKLYCAELDIDRVNAERKRQNTFGSHSATDKPYRTIKADTTAQSIESLTREIPRFPFVPRGEASKDKRMCEIYDILSYPLARRMRHTGTKNPVLGISGGLDSTLALLVTVRAMDILGLPRSGVEAITMPGFGTTSRTLGNARTLMELLGVNMREISIVPACEQHFKDIGHDINNADVTYENSQARERTQILMDIANQVGGFVVGTGDLSELALGWATFAGDHISMYCVNGGVPKTLVRHLVKWISDNTLTDEARNVAEDILNTPVSPELLPTGGDGELVQKTETIIGDYALHDFFLYYFVRFGFSPSKILFLAVSAFDGTYTKEHIKELLTLFCKRFFSNQFKRSCMPDGPKVGSISLSPRADWRMPSDATVNLWLKNLSEE